MILGFIIYGLGWNFVWSGQGKAAKHSVLDMPLWFSGSGGLYTLIIITLLGGLSHLIIAIYIFAWLKGVLFWIAMIVVTQILAAIIFNDARTKNPALPFFVGVLCILIGLLIMVVS